MTRFWDHLCERGQVSTVTCGGCGRSPMDKEQHPASPKCQSERAAETPSGGRPRSGVAHADPVARGARRRRPPRSSPHQRRRHRRPIRHSRKRKRRRRLAAAPGVDLRPTVCMSSRRAAPHRQGIKSSIRQPESGGRCGRCASVGRRRGALLARAEIPENDG